MYFKKMSKRCTNCGSLLTSAMIKGKKYHCAYCNNILSLEKENKNKRKGGIKL